MNPDYIRLTFAIVITGVADLYWKEDHRHPEYFEKSHQPPLRAVLFTLGAAVCWISYILHTFGVLPQ